jgi:hypothetical protein
MGGSKPRGHLPTQAKIKEMGRLEGWKLATRKLAHGDLQLDLE